jgi:hypothetical protein
MVVETGAFRGYFAILPHALREPELRDRILTHYRWWYVKNQHWLGLVGETSAAEARLRLGVGQVIAALIDGLSIQAALDPSGADLGPAFDALALMLKSSPTLLGVGNRSEELNMSREQHWATAPPAHSTRTCRWARRCCSRPPRRRTADEHHAVGDRSHVTLDR